MDVANCSKCSRLYIKNPVLLRILPLRQPCNRAQLDIARALINLPNLRIAPVLLRQPLAHESHPAHPEDGASKVEEEKKVAHVGPLSGAAGPVRTR